MRGHHTGGQHTQSDRVLTMPGKRPRPQADPLPTIGVWRMRVTLTRVLTDDRPARRGLRLGLADESPMRIIGRARLGAR